jgi:hypothetical protein
MRRVTLVVAVAVTVAATLALTVGSALANDARQKETYVDSVKAEQYFALPGKSWFFGQATDIVGDGEPGLEGYLDTRITYTGTPGPGLTNPITGGSWLLCSEFTQEFQDDPLTNPPECTTTPGSAIVLQLQGNVRDGTAVWDKRGDTAVVPAPSGGCIPVYGGVAKVKADFTVTGGTVNGVTVTEEGTGKFKGTLDHRPLLAYNCGVDPIGKYHAILEGTLKLKF